MGIFTVAIYIAAQTTGLRYLYYLAYVLSAVLVAAFVWARQSTISALAARCNQRRRKWAGSLRRRLRSRTCLCARKLWLEVRDRSTLPGHHVGAVISLKGHGGKRWRVKTSVYTSGPVQAWADGDFDRGSVWPGADGASIRTKCGVTGVPGDSASGVSFGMRMGELPGGGRMERRSFHSTPNAAGIRLYQPGDPMNRIHWPMSARTQQLMVKEFELDPTADIWLILDLNEAVHVETWIIQLRRGRRSARRPGGCRG